MAFFSPRAMFMRSICACRSCMAMLWDIFHGQRYARFPARCPVVSPVTAVDEAVTQVGCSVRAVAQVPLLVNQPRVFIDRVSVLKRPGERCYSSGQYPPIL